MPSDKQQIETIKTQTLQQIVDLRVNPKPTYTIDGQNVSWESYLESLQKSIDWCDQKLSQYDPFEIRSQGYTS